LVGIVVVSHSAELVRGLASLVREVAGPEVAVEAAGGDCDAHLAPDESLVSRAIAAADSGDGAVVLGDLGSSFLVAKQVLHQRRNGEVRLVDAPLVEGAVAAAISASTGATLNEVSRAAEETRGALKL
jgi:PTS hybrid protein